MILIDILKKNILDRMGRILLLFFPLLISCSSDQNTVVEVITPPILPKEFSSIPESTENPKLISLISAEEKIQKISIGRKDPFLPLQFESDQLLVPFSFKYHGQISTADLVNAFVSYKDKRGTLKQGDIGGETTDLLPNGWSILSLDTNTKVLTLAFDGKSVEVNLFPGN